MPRSEAGSTKAIGNAIKAKGLTPHRFYCQVCLKGCRDANGYSNHIASETHLRQIIALGRNKGDIIDSMSNRFQSEFLALLSRRFGTRRINANRVYQEYISERHHLHMNATRWPSLTAFVKDMGRQGILQVDDTEQGWFISWVDNSPAALAKQDALQKMRRQRIDEEQRQRQLLAEQIERARSSDRSHQAAPASSAPLLQAGLPDRMAKGFEKVSVALKLNGISSTGANTQVKLGADEETASQTPSGSAILSGHPDCTSFVLRQTFSPGPHHTVNALRRTFRSGAAAQSLLSSRDAKRPIKRTAAELIMAEEADHKRRSQSRRPPRTKSDGNGF